MSEYKPISTQQLKQILAEVEQEVTNGENIVVLINGTFGQTQLTKYELPQAFLKTPGNYYVSIFEIGDGEERKNRPGFPALWTVVPAVDKTANTEQPVNPLLPTMPGTGSGEISLVLSFLEKQAELGRSENQRLKESLLEESKRQQEFMELRIRLHNELSAEREKIHNDRLEEVRRRSNEEKEQLLNSIKESDRLAKERFDQLKEDLKSNPTLESENQFMRFLESNTVKEFIPKIGDALLNLTSPDRGAKNVSGWSTVSSTEERVNETLNRWRNHRGKRK